MWTCHKTPPKIITEKFDYKEYENIGLEWGAYDKVLNDMDLDDDTFLFFIQDDMVIHDWSFINVCVDHFHHYPIILQIQRQHVAFYHQIFVIHHKF